MAQTQGARQAGAGKRQGDAALVYMNPKVTFITVSYKSPDLTRNLLRGVEEAQFSFSYEYIVVDNSVGDATGEMLRTCYPWVRVIDAPGNLGFGRGNNLAFREVKSEYVMLCNPDLLMFPGEMEKLLAFADAHPEYGVIGPRVLNPNGTVQQSYSRFHELMTPVYRRTFLGKTPWGKRALDRFLMKDADLNVVQEMDAIFGMVMLVRREIYEKIGGFDDFFFMYFEDVDFCRRAWEHGSRVCYAPIATFVHYLKRGSDVKHVWEIFTNRLSRAHIASAIYYFWKYSGKPLPHRTEGV